MPRKARSDREPFSVHPYRGRWHGSYYNHAGERKTNIPCVEFIGNPPRAVPLEVTRPNPDDCPNKMRAWEYMKRIHESPAVPIRRAPSLQEAIAEWHQELLVNGCEEAATKDRISKLLATIQGVGKVGRVAKGTDRPICVEGTHWEKLDQVNKHEFKQFLIRLSDVGRAARTRNEYLEIWRLFLDWCADEDLVKVNPLGTVRRAKQSEPAYERRPFTRTEFRLITEKAKVEHRLFYLTLGLSGLRYREARRLRKEHLDPVSDRPYWKLPAKIQKVKLPETLPMMPKLATALAQRWYTVRDGGLLFPDPPSWCKLYTDLRAAGIDKVSDAGEHISFHSFRYFFATEMSKFFPMRKMQLLMRHRSITLTMNLYAKLHLVDIDDQWGVPDLSF